MVLDAGRVMFDGPTAEGLLLLPPADRRRARRRGVGAAAPSPAPSRYPMSSCATAPAGPRPCSERRTAAGAWPSLRAPAARRAARLTLELRGADGACCFAPPPMSRWARTAAQARLRGAGPGAARRRLRPRAGRRPPAPGRVPDGPCGSRSPRSRTPRGVVDLRRQLGVRCRTRRRCREGPRGGAGRGSASRRRREAAAADGADADAGSEPEPPWAVEDPVSARRLAEWAIIEPDEAEVYSTRRYGRPITAVKRLLVRLLRQYFGQVTAQQSRFNAQVAAHVIQARGAGRRARGRARR